MLRPPTTGGRGESDFHDYDDADVPAKRGSIDDHPDTRPSDDPSTDTPSGERPTPGDQPAEGRPDMRLPGADTGSEIPGGSGDDLPQRLGQRIENGSSSSIAMGGTDLLPDVEPPDTTM
jgi:hypothetical protein